MKFPTQRKTILLLILPLFSALSISAQIHKVFLNQNSEKVDSSEASTYILYRQVSDTVWAMKQFTIHDTIVMSGSYKDKDLSVPHGKFTYYYKQSYKNATFSGPRPPDSFFADSINYISTIGYYKNGFKTGTWTEFFGNGNKRYVQNYLKGKLEGTFTSYSYDTNSILITGSYINDKKVGEWDILGINGNAIQRDFYKNGKLNKSEKVLSTYQQPQPKPDFYTYIKKYVGKLASYDTNGELIVVCDITETGKLLNPYVLLKGINPDFNAKVLALVDAMPNWIPAYDTALKQNIKDDVSFALRITNGKVEVANLSYGKELLHQMQADKQ